MNGPKLKRGWDLVGKRFGKLLVLARVQSSNKNTHWKCICDCGNETIVSRPNFKNNHTTSCGCFAVEAQIGNTHSITHGGSGSKSKHNSRPPERLYRIWHGMQNRCFNPIGEKWKAYGGRGITVHSDWLEYPIFKDWALKNGYSDELQIDRINNDGNYEPSNCRFVTPKINSNNRRLPNPSSYPRAGIGYHGRFVKWQ